MKQTIQIVWAVTDSGEKFPLIGFSGPDAEEEADAHITKCSRAPSATTFSPAELMNLRLFKLPLTVHDTTPEKEP